MTRHTLTKDERLHKRKVISRLFTHGDNFMRYPFKVIWMDLDETSKYPAQFGITVSKRYFKSAVHRNRIKRLAREAFRLNKQILYTSLTDSGKTRSFMLIYVAKEILSFQKIEEKIILILQRLSKVNEKAAE